MPGKSLKSSSLKSFEPPSACSVSSEDVVALPFKAGKQSTIEELDDEDDLDEPDLKSSEKKDDDLDRSMTRKEVVEAQVREVAIARLNNASCEFEEDLPTYWQDMCLSKEPDSPDYEFVNLMKNPERNTGYNGSHIWGAMYNENCFEVGQSLPRGRVGSAPMCYEERVLYRLLSGWHTSTTISISKEFYPPGTKVKGEWAPNPERFMQSLGKHPERLKNLHFAFVVMLRAIKRATPFLQTYSYEMASVEETRKTKALVQRLLSSHVLSLCSPLFDAFDETKLFSESKSSRERSALKRQFKNVFQNITVLVDCVQCQKCRLHAKVFSSGLGGALKVLLTPPELLSSTITQDEIVAIISVLGKLSESIEDAKSLLASYWEGDRKAKELVEPPKPKELDSAPPAKPVAAPVHGDSTSAEPRPATPQPIQVQLPEQLPRETMMDLAIRAVKVSKGAGVISAADELAVLRSLIVGTASEQVLLLAKHYAVDQPQIFTQLALEVARSSPSGVVASPLPSVAVPTEKVADALVIGGGLAGMVATVTLLDRGGSVIMIEKQPYLGGNSAKASSGINAALETSVDSLMKDTRKSAAHLARDDLINKLATDSGPAVEWLQRRMNMTLPLRSQLGGHTEKRTLRPANGFIGAEVTFQMGQLLNRMAKENSNFRLLTNTKWKGLVKGSSDKWRVSYVTKAGKEESIEVPSVIIASGGFGHDAMEAESLLLKHRPDLKGWPTTLGHWTTGDGVKIARDLGARVVDMDRVQLHPTGFVDPAKPDEHTKTLGAEILRGVGGLLIDKDGRRFTNELGTRQAVVDAMMKRAVETGVSTEHNKGGVFNIVINEKAAKVADRHVTLYTKKGLLKAVSGWRELEKLLGSPAGQLNSTLEDYNQAAQQGLDAFGRTVFPEHWPVESREQFYIGQVTPVIHYTMGGIAIDVDGHVLSEAAGEPIKGLWAVGEASGGVHGNNRLAGNSLLECTVFGHHAGLVVPISSSQSATIPVPTSQEAAVPSISEAPVQAVAASEMVKTISSTELKKHATKESLWVALYGEVYDLTEYTEEHPGGMQAIIDVAGMDGTETFEAVHNRELLDSMGFKSLGKLVQ